MTSAQPEKRQTSYPERSGLLKRTFAIDVFADPTGMRPWHRRRVPCNTAACPAISPSPSQATKRGPRHITCFALLIAEAFAAGKISKTVFWSYADGAAR